MARKSNFKMGMIELIVLFLLKEKDMYGYQITSVISERSESRVVVNESSLYPTLYKLLDSELISDYEETLGKRRVRVYYHLEKKGEERLEELMAEYNSLTKGMHMIFEGEKL